MDPMFFFYLTGGAMAFLLVSLLLGHGHHGAHGHTGAHGHPGAPGHAGTPGHVGHAGHGAGQSPANAPSQDSTAKVIPARTAQANMSIWSFQMLLLFVAGFGIGGYFASSSALGFVLTMLAGTAGGLALAAIGYFGINFFYRRQGDSNIESREYVGLTGTVITSIGAGAVGQVRCQIGTSTDTFLARAADGTAIPINSVVRVLDMVDSTAVVELTDSTDQTELAWRK